MVMPAAGISSRGTAGPSGCCRGFRLLRRGFFGVGDLPVGYRGHLPPDVVGVGRVVGLSGGDCRQPVHQVVRAPEDVDVAAPGLGDNGRVGLHVGKQQRRDDEAAGVSRDIGASSWREVAAAQVRRNGDGFSNPPARALGCRLPLVVGGDWLVAVFIGVKDAVLGPVAGVRTPF